jgi:hypothetical protein
MENRQDRTTGRITDGVHLGSGNFLFRCRLTLICHINPAQTLSAHACTWKRKECRSFQIIPGSKSASDGKEEKERPESGVLSHPKCQGGPK